MNSTPLFCTKSLHPYIHLYIYIYIYIYIMAALARHEPAGTDIPGTARHGAFLARHGLARHGTEIPWHGAA